MGGVLTRARAVDPRWWQIGVLSTLLVTGIVRLGFDVTWPQVLATLAAGQVAQLAGTRITGLPAFDFRSALISSLSTCLLLRGANPLVLPLGAVLAVASKFVFRVNGKHVLNPTNGAIVLLLLVAPEVVWVSAGQWGDTAFFAFAMAAAGLWVVQHSERSDVTVAFLLAWALVLFGRSWSLGEPMTIPIHRLRTGSLVLFAFFMVSDPKTTPDSRLGRILFAALVAGGAWFVTFRLFRTNGLLWSLAACSLLVPLIDRWLPARRFTWTRPPDRSPEPPPFGVTA